MQLYDLCTVTDLGNNEVRITAKNKRTKYYKYVKFVKDGDNLEVTLRHKRLYFEFDHGESLYCLIGSEDLSRRAPPQPKDMTRAERILQNRKERVKEYFTTHFDKINEVKRFCKIEGVHSFNNIRYEFRRITGFDGVYLIDEKDLTEILKEYGFIVG